MCVCVCVSVCVVFTCVCQRLCGNTMIYIIVKFINLEIIYLHLKFFYQGLYMSNTPPIRSLTSYRDKQLA